jgi:hypothetical protein
VLRLCLPERPDRRLDVLCIGAHSDDIEIGCAATLLTLIERGYALHVTWVVLSAVAERAVEARSSAQALLGQANELQIQLGLPRFLFPGGIRGLEGLHGRTSPPCRSRPRLHPRHR